MSHSDRGRRGYGKRHNNPRTSDGAAKEVDETNPIQMVFKEFAKELDNKHDRYERLVKLSRDITIESKRIIFQLHTIDPSRQNRETVLADVKGRLELLAANNFKAIAKELHGRDPYQFTRAYSAGLQEFIEAFTFYELVSNVPLSGWQRLSETLLKYREEKEGDAEFECLLQPMEYMLGLMDTTGEMMRKCVNALGSGDVDTCFGTCRDLQELYTCYLAIGPVFNREWSRKLFTLKQSLMKAESVCYNVKVRGTEAAKWAVAKSGHNQSAKGELSDDEGIY